MDFLDRVDELDRLTGLLTRSEGSLAVVWGRRRVGKTRLLLEWASRHNGLYTVADQSVAPLQRVYMARAIASKFPGFDDVTYPDWPSLLSRLAQEAKRAGWRGPLVLDEMPYLAAADPAVPSVLQNWIDHGAREASLAVAVAGSSQRMMQDAVLGAEAPLYGRATELIQLRPLSPAYLEEAFPSISPRRAVELYALWGGIPRYWELAAPSGPDLEASLDRLVLDPGGPLHTEPDRLLREETPPAISLRPILDLIGAGVHRMSELGGRLGQPSTSLSKPLARLVELDLVRREQPFGDNPRQGKHSLYRIADPLARLWHSVVAPNRSRLAESPAGTRLGLWKTRRATLEAEAWEELCRASVSRLHTGRSSLGALGPWLPASRWWRANDPEMDVVALSADGARLLVGEAKWPAGPLDTQALASLGARLRARGTGGVAVPAGAEVTHALFVPELSPGCRHPEGVAVVDAGDVMAALR